MERERDDNHRDAEANALPVVDGEGDGSGNDVVELNAGVAAELAHEEEQRDELGEGHQHRCGEVVDAVGERHHKRECHEQEVCQDQGHVVLHAPKGEHDRVDRRENGDHQRHDVDDGEPAAHGARIALRAELDEAAERAEPGEERRLADGRRSGSGHFGPQAHQIWP